MRGAIRHDLALTEIVATFDGPFTPGAGNVFADPFLDPPTGPTQRRSSTP